MTLPKLCLSVDETAERVATYAAVLERCTYVLAAWVASVPETEAKILIGKHVHRDAVATEALRTRLASLGRGGAPPGPPPEPWAGLLSALSRTVSTPTRIHGMYETLKRRLALEMRVHLAETQPVWDEPTVTVVRQVAENLEEQVAAAVGVRDAVGLLFSPELDAAAVRAEWETAVRRASADGDAGIELPEEPARDRRFTVADRTPPFGFSSLEETKYTLHAILMTIELPVIEICGRMIAEFRDMPWEFVLDMGRQCWDESRHASAAYQRAVELGVEMGEYPIENQVWKLSYGLPLAPRLAVIQRVSEWLGVDGAILNARVLEDAGDHVTARMMSYVIVDEITHVGFGNKWVRRLVGNDEDKIRELHDLAMERRAQASDTVIGPPDLPFNRWACELAGFTEEEIDELERARSGQSHPV